MEHGLDETNAYAARLAMLERLDEQRRGALMTNEANQQALKARMDDLVVSKAFEEGNLDLKFDNRL